MVGESLIERELLGEGVTSGSVCSRTTLREVTRRQPPGARYSLRDTLRFQFPPPSPVWFLCHLRRRPCLSSLSPAAVAAASSSSSSREIKRRAGCEDVPLIARVVSISQHTQEKSDQSDKWA